MLLNYDRKMNFMPYLLLFIFETFIPTILSTKISCSSRPIISQCSLLEDDTLPFVNKTINWTNIRPFGLRTAYLLKTDPTTLDLAMFSTIRWRLPYSKRSLPHPVEGFYVNLMNLNTNETKTFTTKLQEQITVLDKRHADVEYFVSSENLLDFGESYQVEVSLLPLGIGGIATHFREIPSKPEKTNGTCSPSTESQNLAKFWRVEFASIDISLVSSDVLVSFLAAPESLCIHRFLIRLEASNRSFAAEYIMNKTSDSRQVHVFKRMPRETSLYIKVVPFSGEGETCPCAGCSCITAKSDTFVIAALALEPLPTQPPPLVYKTTSNFGIWFAGLTVLLLAALCLFGVLVKLHFNSLRDKMIVKHVSGGFGPSRPLLSTKKAYRILVVGSPGSEKETSLIDDLVLLMTNSTHTVDYDRFDWANVEKNTHMWIKNAVAKADTILLLHTKPTNQKVDDSSFFHMVNNVLRIDDERTIFVKLHPDAILMNPTVETVFSLQRDLPLLCSMLTVPFDEKWKQLQLRSQNLYLDDCSIKLNESEKEESEEQPSITSSTNTTQDSGICSFDTYSSTNSIPQLTAIEVSEK